MKSNIEIAQAAKLRPITALAQDRLGIPEEALEPFGRYKAKLSLGYIDSLRDRPYGKLVLVTAISPTPAGEGKTTTAVNLAASLAAAEHRVLLIDLDPQGNASTALGVPHHVEIASVYDVLLDEQPIAGIVQ